MTETTQAASDPLGHEHVRRDERFSASVLIMKGTGKG